MDNIKVGVIRCDLHAWYYGALMFPHDPLALWHENVGHGHAAYFYFYTHYSDPRKITVPTVAGFELARIWDPRPEAATAFASIFGPSAHLCRTFQDVSDGVDLVFIPDCDGDGTDHREFAIPGLEKRVSTFVDKPFAHNLDDARKMVETAQSTDTPVLSLSMLRTLPHAARFRDRLAELNGAQFAMIKGSGPSLAGQIHAISLAQHLFGSGVEAVESMGKGPLAHMLLDYGKTADRPHFGVMLCCDAGPSLHCAFYVSAFSEQGAIHSSDLGDFQFPWGAAKNLELTKKMVITRQSVAPYEEMLEIVAVATAARTAYQERRRVLLKELNPS